MNVRKQRPNFNRAVQALIQDIASSMPEFAHIRPTRVLVVAGEARRASRGTVKPLFPDDEAKKLKMKKPIVRIRGRRMYYCITLRPLFFRSSTPQGRIRTLIHELFHVSKEFDGTLDPAHRHRKLGADFSPKLSPLVRRYLKICPFDLWNDFAHNGDVRIYQWLEKPPSWYRSGKPTQRRIYTEEQLFLGAVQMITRHS
jgi:hypothetical protein